MPTFEASIRLGDILTLLGMLGGGIWIFAGLRTSLIVFGVKLEVLDATVEDLKRDNGIAKEQALQIRLLEQELERARMALDKIKDELAQVQHAVTLLQEKCRYIHSSHEGHHV